MHDYKMNGCDSSLIHRLGYKEKVFEVVAGNGVIQDGTWWGIFYLATSIGQHDSSADTFLHHY